MALKKKALKNTTGKEEIVGYQYLIPFFYDIYRRLYRYGLLKLWTVSG